MQFWKFNRGVGLIQVLLAGALLAGIGLASLQLFNTQRKSVAHSAQQYEEEQIIETIKGLLANEDTCTQTFLLAPTSGTNKDLRSFSGTSQIVAVNTTGSKIAFVKNQAIGKQGLTIINYELNDSAENLKKYFGMPGTPPASPVNTAAYRIKYTVLFVTIKRRESTDNVSGFGSATIKYGIPIVAVTDISVPWLIQICRGASGNNSVWTRTSADMMNIYYADGNVGIGTVPVSTGATVALVQIAGSVYVDGDMTVTESASVASMNVKGQLVIPLVAPTTPQNGMIWMP